MPVSTPSTIAQELGAWAAGLRPADVPAHSLEMARRAVVDIVGVACAGSRMPIARILRKSFAAEFAQGSSTVIGAGFRLSPAAATHLNAAAAHSLDFDANFSIGMVFAPATFVPGLLALAERDERSGLTLLTAFAAASEAVRVLAEVISPEPYTKATDGLYQGGWFNTSVLGPIGAALGASMMLRLDAERTANAISIAAAQAGGLRIAVGSDMKVMLCAQAAERGVRAALYSSAGIEAPDNAFEGGRGFIDVIGRGLWQDKVFATLGRFDDPGISFKRYPSCSSVQAAAEALALIADRDGFAMDEVTHVRCGVTSHIAANLTFPRPENVTQAQFSMPFAMACLMVHGTFTADMLNMEMVRDPAIVAAMDRVEMVHDRALDTEEIRREAPEASEVTVTLADGRRFSHRQLAATGKPANPMSDALLDAKFLENVAPLVAAPDAARLLERLRGLDKLDRMSDLLRDVVLTSEAAA